MTAELNKSPPQQAHTPGPYHVEDEFVFAGNGLRIADTSCEDQDMLDGEDAANAAFIVRACNNHDELLDALAGLVNAVSVGIRIGAVTADFLLDQRMKIGLAALAKARGR
jgi:hypothetical protein